MLYYYSVVSSEKDAGWDKPIEFPKPGKTPEIPTKQEPPAPDPVPHEPEIRPIEKPEREGPSEVPQPD